MMKNPRIQRLKEIFLTNIPLKILAVLVAIIVWIVIINVSDPSQRVTISGISVALQNEEVLIDKGYIYQVESGGSISIVVKGPQTVVENLKASDFYAYADLGERTPESDTAKIYVSCTNDEIAGKIDIVSQKSEYVQLVIDNKVDKDLPIQIAITGIPESGYVVGEYSSSPTTIKVTGAENIIGKIAYAEISYDVESMNADVSDSVTPVFYDAEGKIIKADKLELSKSDVQLKIEILPTKWIKVNYVVSGEPAEGYSLSGYTENLTSINVAARKDQLANYAAIDIPSGVVDITGATADEKITVSLAPYLPAGFRIVSSMTVLEVQTTIEKISDGIINVPVEDISITGLGKDYLYEITTVDSESVLEVGVKGVEEVINSLTASDLEPTINLSGKKDGVHTVKVTLTTGEEYTIAKTYYVKVTITDKYAEEPTEETTENEVTEAGADINSTNENTSEQID